MRALGILLIWRRHANNAAGFAITAQISHQDAQHALRIEAIRLGPARPAVDEDAGGLKHIAGNTMFSQQPMQPEAVASRLKAADNSDRHPQLGGGTRRLLAAS